MANSMDKCVLKYDHLENIHRLPLTVLTIYGAPNFRKVPGFIVFGTGGPLRRHIFYLGLYRNDRLRFPCDFFIYFSF